MVRTFLNIYIHILKVYMELGSEAFILFLQVK